MTSTEKKRQHAAHDLGIGDEGLSMLGAALVVLIRGLLPIISSLNMVKLRDDFQTLLRMTLYYSVYDFMRSFH